MTSSTRSPRAASISEWRSAAVDVFETRMRRPRVGIVEPRRRRGIVDDRHHVETAERSGRVGHLDDGVVLVVVLQAQRPLIVACIA